jgi:hypothetical protein
VPEGRAELFSKRLGLIVLGWLPPLFTSVDIPVEAEVGSSISGGIGRVVTM